LVVHINPQTCNACDLIGGASLHFAKIPRSKTNANVHVMPLVGELRRSALYLSDGGAPVRNSIGQCPQKHMQSVWHFVAKRGQEGRHIARHTYASLSIVGEKGAGIPACPPSTFTRLRPHIRLARRLSPSRKWAACVRRAF